MGLLDKLTDRLSSSISKLENAASRTSGKASTAQTALNESGGNVRLAALAGDERNLSSAIKAETRARLAAAKQIELGVAQGKIELAQQKAVLPQLRAQAKLAATAARGHDSQLRAVQAEERLRMKAGVKLGMSAGDAFAALMGPAAPKISGRNVWEGLTGTSHPNVTDYSSANAAAMIAEKERAADAIRRKQLAATADDIDLARAAAQRRRGSGAAKAVEPAGGSGVMQALMNRGGPVGAAIAAIYMANKGMGVAAKGINLYNRTDLGSGQKARIVFETLTGNVIKFAEALKGVTENIRQQNVALENSRLRIPASYAAQSRAHGLEVEGARASYDFQAVGAVAYQPLQTFDRSTGAGIQSHSEYQSRLPILEAMTRGRRTALAAAAEAHSLRSYANNAHVMLSQAVGQHERARQAQRRYVAGGGSNPSTLTGLAAAEVTTNANVEQARNQALNAETEARNGARRAVEEERAARQPLISLMQNELQVLQQREQRIRGNAQGFGDMNPAERQEAVFALRAEQDIGYGNLTPEMRGSLRGASPRYAALRAQQFGESTPEYQEFSRRGAFFGDTQSLADVQGEQNRVQANIRTVINLNERELASLINDGLNRDLRQIVNTIMATVDDRLGALEAERQLRNANP